MPNIVLQAFIQCFLQKSYLIQFLILKIVLLLPHYPLIHPSHKKFILHTVSKIIFCLVLKLGFMFPHTSVKQMYLMFQLNIFFCVQYFLLYMCLHFICCSFGQRQHAPISPSPSLFLSFSLIFFFFLPECMFQLTGWIICATSWDNTVCYFSLSTYTIHYLAPLIISSIKLQ